MANNNIHVKVDHNNLIYIDPNSIVSGNKVIPRNIDQENLIMYVNLEADMIPRSFLYANKTNQEKKSRLTHIAGGKLNFLRKQSGQDFSTEWTEVFTPTNEATSPLDVDITGQSFGIQNINIVVKGANFIPQIVINFVDVRGKVLFDSPKNSPYSAFFNLPWPIFYLTIKGYYGKAIRYRLHMVKFSNKFNGSTGNFEVTATFVGSTYAYISDIPMSAIMNAPYMFMKEKESTIKTNGKDQTITTIISKDTKGYQMLKSVYDEMKGKKLIPNDFPVVTLRELGVIAETLDKRLSEAIFQRIISPELITAIKKYDDELNKFSLALNGWVSLHLTPFSQTFDDTEYYSLKVPSDLDKNIIGIKVNGTLENLLVDYNAKLLKIADFSKIPQNDKKLKQNTRMFTKRMGSVNNYFIKKYDNYFINKDLLLSDIDEIKKTFKEQSEKIYLEIEKEMNTILKSKDNGIGFEPTLRNVLAIILSNADVYIRLMKEIHTNAYSVSNERKDLIKEFDQETQNSESVFPWPQIRKKNEKTSNMEISYPGDSKLRDRLNANNGRLWPEIEFVEEYLKVSTYKSDPSNKEGGKSNVNFVFETDSDKSYINNISTLFVGDVPYTEKTISSFLYEIVERAKYSTYTDSFDTNIINRLATLESETINKIVENETYLSSLFFDEIRSVSDLERALQNYSKNKRYPYFSDSIPTIEYIDQNLINSFSIENPLHATAAPASNNEKNEEINSLLENYVPESYRLNIYPFSSPEYLKYIGGKNNIENLKIKNALRINSDSDFISGEFNPKMWVKSQYITGNTINLFSQKLKAGDNYTNILNTPYFHKQLYGDFHKTEGYGKYSGSAYLLLNSLPFNDLEDYLTTSGNTQVRMSSLFREVAAIHYVPYHLLLKWGGIYHRYKTKIKTGNDILISDISDNIDFHEFFNNNTNESYTIGTDTITYSGETDLGFHPYYDGIFSQIVNGYAHFDMTPGSGSTLNDNVNIGAIIPRTQKTLTNRYWSMIIDNSKYNQDDLRYTFLPTNGNNKFYQANPNDENINFRVIWEDERITDAYTGRTFPSYNEYPRSFNETTKSLDNLYSLGENYRKCIDLIGTFSPKILDELELLFLEFSSEILNTETASNTYNVSYGNFQILLKSLSSVQKTKKDTNDVLTINKKQSQEILEISNTICSPKNLLKVKIGNPKEIDPYILEGFALGLNSFTYNKYNPSQLVDNQKYIELYIGEDIDSKYLNFFIDNNVELNETNVLSLRPIIMIYAGYLKNYGIPTKSEFASYLTTNIIAPSKNRYGLFLTQLMSKVSTTKNQNQVRKINYVDGVDLEKIKIELYSTFKSFNDKWASGNSIGENLLLEEFLFLDKANRDIGQLAYINIDRIKSLLSPLNSKMDLYSAISTLLQGTGFDMRALPSYVNFYGVSNLSTSINIASKTANDLFGVFTDLDYRESSPKILIQYVDAPSSHLDMESQKSLYKNDTYNIGELNKNGALLTMPKLFSKEEMERSNKVVAFQVNFGDVEQNIFKEISLDQETIRNTSESFVVVESLGRNESGAGATTVDTQLFEYYRQAAYSCEVTCMGNVMIQPTMYFYLNNVPMFKGTYWITEVSHTLGEGSFKTVFKGARMPAPTYPTLDNAFMATYRSLLEKIQRQALEVIKAKDTNPT